MGGYNAFDYKPSIIGYSVSKCWGDDHTKVGEKRYCEKHKDEALKIAHSKEKRCNLDRVVYGDKQQICIGNSFEHCGQVVKMEHIGLEKAFTSFVRVTFENGDFVEIYNCTMLFYESS